MRGEGGCVCVQSSQGVECGALSAAGCGEPY